MQEFVMHKTKEFAAFQYFTINKRICILNLQALGRSDDVSNTENVSDGNAVVNTFDSVQCLIAHLELLITFIHVLLNSIQSNEVKNSYHMELEGLKRCLARLETEEIEVSHLVTYRPSQVKAYMKRQQAQIVHMFDVWHVVKGMHYATKIVHDELKNCLY